MAEPIVTSCPECGKGIRCKPELAGKNAKCPCGATFKVPFTSKPAAGSFPPAPTVAPSRGSAPLGKPGGKRTDARDAAANAEERANLIKMAVLAVVVVGVIVGGIIAVKTFGGRTPTGPQLGEDATVEAKIADEYGTEAREWLNGRKGRMLGGWNENQSEFNINNWYNLGAKKVYAFGGLMTLAVAIEMPITDQDKRKALIDWANKFHEERPDIPQFKDEGQKYLLIRLKL